MQVLDTHLLGMQMLAVKADYLELLVHSGSIGTYNAHDSPEPEFTSGVAGTGAASARVPVPVSSASASRAATGDSNTMSRSFNPPTLAQALLQSRMGRILEDLESMMDKTKKVFKKSVRKHRSNLWMEEQHGSSESAREGSDQHDTGPVAAESNENGNSLAGALEDGQEVVGVHPPSKSAQHQGDHHPDSDCESPWTSGSEVDPLSRAAGGTQTDATDDAPELTPERNADSEIVGKGEVSRKRMKV